MFAYKVQKQQAFLLVYDVTHSPELKSPVSPGIDCIWSQPEDQGVLLLTPSPGFVNQCSDAEAAKGTAAIGGKAELFAADVAAEAFLADDEKANAAIARAAEDDEKADDGKVKSAAEEATADAVAAAAIAAKSVRRRQGLFAAICQASAKAVLSPADNSKRLFGLQPQIVGHSAHSPASLDFINKDFVPVTDEAANAASADFIASSVVDLTLLDNLIGNMPESEFEAMCNDKTANGAKGTDDIPSAFQASIQNFHVRFFFCRKFYLMKKERVALSFGTIMLPILLMTPDHSDRSRSVTSCLFFCFLFSLYRWQPRRIGRRALVH